MADAILLTGGGSNADVEGQHVTNTDVYPGDVFLDLDGAPATGSMTTLGAQTIQPKNSNQTISAGRYLVGEQTIAPVVVANLSAANVKQGITIGVGYAGATGAIATAAGTFTNDANATKNGIRSGYKGWVKGQEVVGELGSVAAKAWTPSTSIQTMSGSTYYGGAQTLNAIPGNANRAQVVTNYTFGSTNGANLTGSIPVYSGTTSISPSTAQQTITTAIANHYVPSNISVSGVGTTNFTAANIKKGTTITIAQKQVTGSFEGYVTNFYVYNAGSWANGWSSSYLKPADHRQRYNSTYIKHESVCEVAFQTSNIKVSHGKRTTYVEDGTTYYTGSILAFCLTKSIDVTNYNFLEIHGNTGFIVYYPSYTYWNEFSIWMQKTADYAQYQYSTSSSTNRWSRSNVSSYGNQYSYYFAECMNSPFLMQLDTSSKTYAGYLLVQMPGRRPATQSSSYSTIGYSLVEKILLY